MTFFIIGALEPSQEKQNLITKSFKDAGYGWWHWIPNFWIVVSDYDNVTSVQVRDHLMGLAPGLEFIVLGVNPKTDWGSFGNPAWQEWLHNNWKSQQ